LRVPGPAETPELWELGELPAWGFRGRDEIGEIRVEIDGGNIAKLDGMAQRAQFSLWSTVGPCHSPVLCCCMDLVPCGSSPFARVGPTWSNQVGQGESGALMSLSQRGCRKRNIISSRTAFQIKNSAHSLCPRWGLRGGEAECDQAGRLDQLVGGHHGVLYGLI
jgi:hypothetical protein